MTILFLDDWKKHPNAIIDINTQNKSFLRTAGLFKKMGIKNHAFLLALHDKTLRGIDPHSPDLTKEQLSRVIMECKVNYWYYVREVISVPSVSGVGRIQYRANRGNIALFWLFFNHVMTMLIQPRQTGKSLGTDVLMRWLTNIGCANTNINLLTKDDTLRLSNLARLKDIEAELPYYLRLTTKKDINNTEMYTVRALGNTYRGHVPQSSPKAALKVGRGLTSPIFHIDEPPFQPNIDISLPAALAAGGAARDLAEVKDEPYGTIITTTAGRLDDPSGRYVYGMLQEAAVWTEKFYDCKDIKELHNVIRKNAPGKTLRVNCTFSHRQLGYTDEWLRKKLEESNAKGEAAEADYFNKWVSGSSKSPLKKSIIDIIRKSQQLDFYTEISSYGYITRWYISEGEVSNLIDRGPVVMALDTSDAIGNDDIAMTMRSIYTGEVLAAGNYNETNLFTFSEWLLTWLTKLPNLTMIIERRSSAISMFDYLIKTLMLNNIDPFKRLFNWVVDEAEEKPDRFKLITQPMQHRDEIVYTKFRKEFGYATSASGRASRDNLYGTALTAATKYTGNTVRDVNTINQILALTTKNGRIDHPEGGKDDLCITWLLSYWFLTKARNLSYYGIDTRQVLRNIKKDTSNMDVQKIAESKYQDQLRYKIDMLAEQLKNEKDDFIAISLERQIRALTEKLSLSENEVFNLDSLLEDLKMKRKAYRHKK
jgi:hypothetical protein